MSRDRYKPKREGRGVLIQGVVISCSTADCRQKLCRVQFDAPSGMLTMFECPKCKEGTVVEKSPFGIRVSPLEDS